MNAPRTPDVPPVPVSEPGTEAPLPRSRRAFLVWTVLAGFAEPERLAEAIVAELEREADA